MSGLTTEDILGNDNGRTWALDQLINSGHYVEAYMDGVRYAIPKVWVDKVSEIVWRDAMDDPNFVAGMEKAKADMEAGRVRPWADIKAEAEQKRIGFCGSCHTPGFYAGDNLHPCTPVTEEGTDGEPD